MAASGYCGVVEMMNCVGIYGFCLFKKKSVVRADVSINSNMYGLLLCAAEWMLVLTCLRNTNTHNVSGVAVKRISEEDDEVNFFVTSSSMLGCGQVETVELEHANAVCLCLRDEVDSRYCFIIITNAFG